MKKIYQKLKWNRKIKKSDYIRFPPAATSIIKTSNSKSCNNVPRFL